MRHLALIAALVSCLRSSSPFATCFGEKQATGKTQRVRRFPPHRLVHFAGIAALAGLSACSSLNLSGGPPIPAVCEDQVYADPVVKDLILKGSGSSTFKINHEDQLRFAKIDAAHRCMQQKGLAAPGGGVARPNIAS